MEEQNTEDKRPELTQAIGELKAFEARCIENFPVHLFPETLEEYALRLISIGRESVLNDFDDMCKADAFMGFTEDEWKAIKKFFDFNNDLRKANNN